ncbi:hypothetical protein BDR26DRAFT_866207 [Obelidium mucronatum]|nr:hypothetical protein BDR26DRAFT_866207 [Obelidium mucronatum]
MLRKLTPQEVQLGIDEVQLMCPHLASEDIRLDLEASGSIEATINRVFDSLFLVGTRKDPSLALLSEPDFAQDEFRPATEPSSCSRPPPALKKTETICLDSSDDDAELIDLSQKSSSYRAMPHVAPTTTTAMPSSLLVSSNKGSDVVVIDDSDEEIPLPTPRKPVQFRPLSSITVSPPPEKCTFSPKAPLSWKAQLEREAAFLASSSDEDKPKKPKKREILGLSTSSWLDKPLDSSDDEDSGKKEDDKKKKKKQEKEKKKSGSSHLNDLMNKKYGMVQSDSDDSDCSPKRRRKGDASGSDVDEMKKSRKRKKGRSRNADSSSSSSSDEETNSKKKKKSSADKEAEKRYKAEERERVKQEKAEAKRLEKEEKEREKERKKLEKEAAKKITAETTAANKLRDKRAAVTEMTVVIDPSFVTALPGGARIIDAVQEVGAKIAMSRQDIPSALQWTRNVTRQWNADREIWIPCVPRIETEPYVLVRLSATEFSKLVLEDDGVDKYLLNIRRLYGQQNKPILFIEGMRDLLKSRTKIISNQIQTQVRMMGGGSVGNAGSRSQSHQKIASKEEFDVALLRLQMFGDCFVQLSETLEETADLIVSFTTSIAMIPERKSRSEQQLRLNFGDTVKSGDSLSDVWRRMLMEVKPLSVAAADIIMKDYPSYRSLMDTYSRTPARERESLLEHIRIDLVTSQRKLGPKMSKKICLALTCEDENVAVFEAPPPKKQYHVESGGGNSSAAGGSNHFQRANFYSRGGGRGGFGRGRGRGG